MVYIAIETVYEDDNSMFVIEMDVLGSGERLQLIDAFRFIADVLEKENKFNEKNLEYLLDVTMKDNIKVKNEEIEYF